MGFLSWWSSTDPGFRQQLNLAANSGFWQQLPTLRNVWSVSKICKAWCTFQVMCHDLKMIHPGWCVQCLVSHTLSHPGNASCFWDQNIWWHDTLAHRSNPQSSCIKHGHGFSYMYSCAAAANQVAIQALKPIFCIQIIYIPSSFYAFPLMHQVCNQHNWDSCGHRLHRAMPGVFDCHSTAALKSMHVQTQSKSAKNQAPTTNHQTRFQEFI